MDALKIAEGSVVADLGAGGGWFTVRLARRVGPNGLVYAEDIQPLMIEAIKRRVQRENLTNVRTVLGTPKDSRLPHGLDAVLIVGAYHEMEDPVTLLEERRRLAEAAGPHRRRGLLGRRGRPGAGARPARRCRNGDPRRHRRQPRGHLARDRSRRSCSCSCSASPRPPRARPAEPPYPIMRVALTIAGSDSSGGAGIQADLKTFAALGVYGTSAITAVTAQSTVGVVESLALSADLVTAQIEAVAGDIEIHATKTGMLGDAAIVEAVAAAIKELDLPLVVVDPVIASKRGDRAARRRRRADAVRGAPPARARRHAEHPRGGSAERHAASRRRGRRAGSRPADSRHGSGGRHHHRRASAGHRRGRRTCCSTASASRCFARRASTAGTRTAPAARSPPRSPRTWRWATTLADGRRTRAAVRGRRDSPRPRHRPRPRAARSLLEISNLVIWSSRHLVID